ncbi:MAG: LLM class F420-dependent oxidoreductase [Nitriliruptorales bacterium]
MPDATLAVDLPTAAGIAPGDALSLVRAARDWGYEACWTSEVQGPDAFTMLGALAATADFELGVAVVPVQTRTPMVLGMTAVTLAQLTGGRFTLGIGASSEVIVERWAGQPFDAPLVHVRETVEALRPILRGERSKFEGRYVRVGGFKPHAAPPAAVPLFLGSLNRRSLRQAGELGDGVCLNQLAPRHVPALLEHVRDGAGAAGRELRFGAGPDRFGVMARLFCAVTDDVPAARQVVKTIFGPYLATAVYNRYYRSIGYEEEAEAVAAAAARGDREGIVAGMSDRLVDDCFVLGGPREVAEKVRAYVDNGVTTVSIAVLNPDPDGAVTTLRAIAEGWA